MGVDKRGAEDRRPNEQCGEFGNEEEVSDIEDMDDDGDGSDDTDDTDEEDIEIPDDPVMEARLVALRLENAALVARAKEEEGVRALVIGRAGEWKGKVEALQAALTRAKALIKEREEATNGGGEGEGGCEPLKGPNGRKDHEDDEGTSKGQNHVVEGRLLNLRID